MMQEDFLVFVKHSKSKIKIPADLNPNMAKQCLPSLFLISLVIIVDDGDFLTKSLFNSK